MKIIRADYILSMNENFEIFTNKAVAFDTKIVAIDSEDVLQKCYPQAEILDAGIDSVLMPGLINPHVHLEFSANKTTLRYGDFIQWLQSVIIHRETLIGECKEICIKKVLDQMLQSGTTTIGAVSSFGFDLKPCAYAPMNVVYFNEVLGSNPAAVDALYQDFLGRLYESQTYMKDNFIPAISVHSPYSTHPVLAKKALQIAKDQNMTVSTHFMESHAEREWLDSGSGDFASFFESFSPGSKPVNDAMGYLSLFEDTRILFTHATYATDEELNYMQKLGYITHCPISNRLLNNGRLAIEKIDKLTIGTDGLSSNMTLNLWDEMRAALWMHVDIEPNVLAQSLLYAATKEGAVSLGRNSGQIKEGKDADLIVVQLPEAISQNQALSLQLLLHTTHADKVFIAGEQKI